MGIGTTKNRRVFAKRNSALPGFPREPPRDHPHHTAVRRIHQPDAVEQSLQIRISLARLRAHSPRGRRIFTKKIVQAHLERGGKTLKVLQARDFSAAFDIGNVASSQPAALLDISLRKPAQVTKHADAIPDSHFLPPLRVPRSRVIGLDQGRNSGARGTRLAGA